MMFGRHQKINVCMRLSAHVPFISRPSVQPRFLTGSAYDANWFSDVLEAISQARDALPVALVGLKAIVSSADQSSTGLYQK